MNSSLKTRIRQHALARRSQVPLAHRKLFEQQSLELAPLIASWAPSPTIAGYMPFRDECNPLGLMGRLARSHLKVAIPRIEARHQPLHFHRWTPVDELVGGPFGLKEPAENRATVIPDILLVPLAAFDQRGNRIGYGGGFYDRTLEQLRTQKRCLAIGLAFSVQQVASIEAEQHDQQLDLILTEKGLWERR